MVLLTEKKILTVKNRTVKEYECQNEGQNRLGPVKNDLSCYDFEFIKQ